MKKVIFGAAALLFSGVMMAQGPVSQSTLKAVDGSDTADTQLAVDLATDDGNYGEAIQTGNTNKLQVLQAGTNQSSYSVQGDGLGTGDNRARIWQTGDVTGISGVDNAADVRQLGSGNESTTMQEGDSNEAVTRQGLKDGGLSGGNRALINHGTAENGEFNYAMVEQDGQTNSAWTVQSFDNNEARTVQEGDSNMSGVRQKSGPDGSAGNSALNEQYGDMNSSKIKQVGHNNYAQAAQKGDANKADQKQTGDSNAAYVDQGQNLYGITDGLTGPTLDVFADPLATQGAGGPDSQAGMAIQRQTGNSNFAYASQYGSDGEASNHAEQYQVGNSNQAAIDQNANGIANGGANYARQDQTGNSNVSFTGQNGRDHMAYSRQNGDFNIALASQKGNANLVSTFQEGEDNWAVSGQRGHDNQVLIVQKNDGISGGHSFKASQNIDDPYTNGGNTISVLQLGPSGNIMTDGENCDFQDAVTPGMPAGVDGFDLAAPCTPGASGC
ncbi:curlin [Lacinutrix sp. Bg11-31]|uniref:curlin n=1 Tax=Lacinutrix sp. Bg11-31 TaxID=2057808 RepID=UPI000C3056BA|nr:curlin [Lacinutrix sp. Bg11-31]AUC82228.1 curlin [Lacinutrix sp. Bg11-31]